MKLCCYDVSVFKSNNETVNPDLERINGEAPTVDLNNHVTGVGFTLEFKQSTWRHKYFGDLRDGKAHGRGELFSSDGATTVEFVGTFYKGRWWKGKVTYSNPDHDTNVTVDVENGVFNGGEGTYKVVNISGFASYDGELSGREKPKPNGMGELKVFKDGILVYHYKGQFRNGVEHGKGVIYQNGGTFTGSLRKGNGVARLFLTMDRFVYTKKVNVLKSKSLKPRQPVSSFLLCMRRLLCLYIPYI